MIRMSHFLPEPQVKALRALAKKTGLTVADLIRRAVEVYLRREADKRN
jgi:hypothetical protein